MDKLVKAMKVIRLKDEDFGHYLTASDDQVSVILTTPNSQNYNPKNTEWRLEWLKGPKNLDGQVRLFSIYNKALTFTAKDDPANYWSSPTTTALTQQPWPPPSSDVGEAAASEWRFLIRNEENGILVGELLKWSEKCGENYALSAIVPILDGQVRLFSKPNSQNYNPKNTEWRLEWLKGPKNLDGQVRLFSTYNKAHTLTAKLDYSADCNFFLAIPTALAQLPRPPPSSDVGEAAASEWRLAIRNRENGVLFGKYGNLKKLYNFSCCWIIEVVVVGDDNVVLTPSTVTQKISTTSPNNKAMTNTSPDTKQIKSLKQETSSAPLDKQPKKLNEQHIVRRNYGGRSSGVGYFGDHFMNAFPRWQVGQVFFNVSRTPNGFPTSAGYKYGQYANAGGNVNGSGVQKNGDVSLYNEINRNRDNNAKFVNHGYDLSD